MKYTKTTGCLIISSFSLYASSSPETLPDAESFLRGGTNSFHFPAESQPPRGSSDVKLNGNKRWPRTRLQPGNGGSPARKPLQRPSSPHAAQEGHMGGSVQVCGALSAILPPKISSGSWCDLVKIQAPFYPQWGARNPTLLSFIHKGLPNVILQSRMFSFASFTY